VTVACSSKSQFFNIRHDGILSIRNFMLMINNHFAIFQLPGNLLKTKKCAPYFRGNTQFPIYFIFIFITHILYFPYGKYWFRAGEIKWRFFTFKVFLYLKSSLERNYTLKSVPSLDLYVFSSTFFKKMNFSVIIIYIHCLDGQFAIFLKNCITRQEYPGN
jgi:hypothetical protein